MVAPAVLQLIDQARQAQARAAEDSTATTSARRLFLDALKLDVDPKNRSDIDDNMNRLNVAISRAQCIAILVRGTNLLEMSPRNIGDLERLEGFARADEMFGQV